jgi:hypothetical protein
MANGANEAGSHYCSDPGLPRPECQFILDTDASHDATSVVLSQIIDGNEHVIAYMSKTMNQHEKQYCINKKELLAVVRALKHFHDYL